MILKFIHDNFTLDLANYEFAQVEENNWFTNQLFTKYTYPIEIELTDEQDAELEYITHQNKANKVTIFEGQFYTQGQDHDAVLEVEKIIGRVITAQIRYGFEELPNAQKKLSELPLDDFVIAEPDDIFSYADSIINTTWPTHNFCFPKIWTEKIDTERPQWQAFEGAINNYVSGAMLENEYDVVEDLQINRNLMQPMPFLLHVLIKGFEDAGYTLTGDILEDPEFTKAFIYHFSEYYSSINEEAMQFILNTDQYQTLINPIRASYAEEIVLTEPGRYKISGNVVVRKEIGFDQHYFQLDYNGTRIYRLETRKNSAQELFRAIDINIDFYGGEGPISVTSINLPFSDTNGLIDPQAMIADLSITQLTSFDANGDPLPSLIVPNEIKLSKCVPDSTFAKLVETIRLWKNFDLTINGDQITMNYLTKKFSTANAVSLIDFEVQYPEINFNQGRSFVLKFQDINTDNFPEYQYPEIYMDINGIQQTPFVKKDTTEEIIIDAVPLPLKKAKTQISAHDFLDDKNALFIGMYNGLVSGNNQVMDPAPLMIPAIFVDYYEEWFDFLLRSISYLWNFMSPPEKLQALKVKSVIYAYREYHVIERISRSNVTPELIYTELECKTLV